MCITTAVETSNSKQFSSLENHDNDNDDTEVVDKLSIQAYNCI